MKVVWKSKKMMAIVGGGIAVFLILALALGLAFGLDDGGSKIKKYLISGTEYTKDELLKNGYTKYGVNYQFKEKDDGLYLVLPPETVLTSTPGVLQDTNFGHNISIGGEDAHEFEGKNHFYNISFAGIGVVKIPNDGYIWGGFYLNNNMPTLRSGLTEPVEFAKINENGDALFNLARVFELQENIEVNESVNSAYVLNKESDRVGTWRIFAYDDGSEVTMRVATKTYPHLVAEIWYNPPLLSSDKITEWPSTDGEAYWGQDENSKPQAFNNQNHPAIDFNIGDLVDANGDPLTVTWLVGGLPNTSYDIPLTNMFYKVQITGGKAEIPLVDKKVQISPDGKFEVSGQTFQIPMKSDVYTLTSDLEVKVN